MAAVFISRDDQSRTFRYVRDDDVAERLLDNVGDIGFAGSDTVQEWPEPQRQKLVIEPITVLAGMRFALGCLKKKRVAVEQKIQKGEELKIGTPYPQTTALITRQSDMRLIVEKTATGRAEGLADAYPALDGIVEFVDSGRTFVDNDLVIVRDNLLPVAVCAIWKMNQSNLMYNGGNYGTINTTV